jgi:hypothetical protein
MSHRTFAIAAGALAASFVPGFGVGAAEARTPLAIDPVEAPIGAMQPSAYTVSPPSAFQPVEEVDEAALGAAATVDASGPRLQCVPFAREASGVEIYGNANTWWAQAAGRFARVRAPETGAVMVMRGYRTNTRGHVAVVREIVSERIVIIDHANWLNRGEITRGVPVRDVSAAGDWSAVQVWHVPGGHWGGRIYRVQGFILRGDTPPEGAGAPAPDAAVTAVTPVS